MQRIPDELQAMNFLDEPQLQKAASGNRLVGRRVRVVPECESTNDLCHSAASDSANEGLVIFAEHQLAGRGRYGRQWSAPPGSSLLFSVLLFPVQRISDASFLTAWSAVGVSGQLRASFALDCRIKWPNDLMVDGKKLCGILVERRQGTVVGIGLNVSILPQEFPAELRSSATSLRMLTGLDIDRTALAAELLSRLDTDYAKATERGPEDLMRRWSEYAEDFADALVVAHTRRTKVVGRLLELRPDFGARLQRADGSVARIPPEELIRLERS